MRFCSEDKKHCKKLIVFVPKQSKNPRTKRGKENKNKKFTYSGLMER